MIRDEFRALQPVYTSMQGLGIEIRVRSPPVLCLFVGFKQRPKALELEEWGWMVPVPLSCCKSGRGPPAPERIAMLAQVQRLETYTAVSLGDKAWLFSR